MNEVAAGDRLVIFGPLPPKPNGIADYSFELLTGLVRQFRCVAVVEDEQSETLAPPGVEVLCAAEYLMQSGRFASDLHIYHLGNNPDHTYLLRFMAERPGVIVLHDPSLHHLLDRVTVALGDFSGYADALEAEHGVAGRVLGEQFRRYQLRERQMFFDMPMLHGIAAPSRGVIVHSRYAAVKVMARAPETPVTVVPHQFCPPPAEEMDDPASVRRALGVGPDEMLFMSLGFMTRSKRIDAALRALAIVRDELPPFKYVIAGEQHEEETNVAALAAALGLSANVLITGYVEEREFFSLIRAADVVINLRHPVAGETSGTMIRALGNGACLVVVDRGPFAEVPRGAAVHVPWTEDFDRHLAQELLSLALDPERRRRIGANARAFILRNNNLDMTVAGYRRAIEKARAITAPAWASRTRWEFLPPQRLAELVRSARAAQGDGALPLWFETGAVPVRGEGAPQALVVAEAADAALLQRLGYRPESIDVASVVRDDLAVDEARATELALVLSDAALRDEDVEAVLSWLNRKLAYGGVLVWNLRRRAGDPHRLLDKRDAAARLFAAYGFRIDAVFGGNPPQVDDPPENGAPAQEESCWRLFKISEAVSTEFKFAPPRGRRSLFPADIRA